MDNQEMLKDIVDLSHHYGSDKEFVLAGGGNTSCKDNAHLYIKGSGTSLKTITEHGFVNMNRSRLAQIWNKAYSADDKAREAEVLDDLMKARGESEGAKRPSVEVLLHDLFPQRYVVHTHPAVINGVTCSSGGAYAIKEMFGDSVVWVDEIKPGYSLAEKVRTLMSEYRVKQGVPADILFLQNHGIFIAADTPEEIKKKTNGVVETITGRISKFPDFSPLGYDEEMAEGVASFIEKHLSQSDSTSAVSFRINKTIYEFIKDRASFSELEKPFSPDHIVYCKHEFVFVPQGKDMEELYKALAEAMEAYKARNGFFPKVIVVEKLGVFTCGGTRNDSDITADLFEDAVKIAVYSQSFGGPRTMSEELVRFICTWEVESYRKKVSLTESQSKG